MSARGFLARLPRGLYNRTVLPLQHVLSEQLLKLFLPKFLAIDSAFNTYIKTALNGLLIFPTNICNARCTFCAYPTNVDKKSVMSYSVAKKSIDDAVELGSESICFTPNLGDSLVDKHLIQKLEYAKHRGAKYTYMYTNGILLSRRDYAERLVDYLDAIYISNPGLSREAYLRLYQVDKCDEVVEGILRLARYKRLAGKSTKLVLEFRIDRPISEVMADEGMQQVNEFIADGTIEIGTIISEMDNWGGAISQDNLSGTMKIKQIASSARDLPCQMLFQTPAVLPDGSVRACSCWYVITNYDELTLDNVMDSHLGEILFGKKHRDILIRWANRELPLSCETCTYYKPFSMGNGRLIRAIASVAFHRTPSE